MSRTPAEEHWAITNMWAVMLDAINEVNKRRNNEARKAEHMSDDFKFQISVKLGDALFNVRGSSPEEFATNLAFAAKNASQVRAFCEDFKPHTSTPQPSGGAANPPSTSSSSSPAAPAALFQPPPAPPGAHRVTIKGIESKDGEKDGKPWSLWKITFSDMRVASTFDPLLASVAQKIYGEGSGCVAFTKPAKNPKYLDLESLQRAL